ncbi:MAG: ABC transporter permease [Anaerolineae bacterium]
MRKALIIARHEYSVNVRRPGFILMTVLIPLSGLVILLVAAFFGGQVDSMLEQVFSPDVKPAAVLDHSGLFTPIQPGHERFVQVADEASGREMVLSGQMVMLLVIPADYVQTGGIEVVSKNGGIEVESALESSELRAFLVDHLLRDRVDDALRARLAQPIEPVRRLLDEGGAEGQGLNGAIAGILLPYFTGLLLVITVFVSSGYLLRDVSEEKSNRIIEILVSSVAPHELLAGKVLGLGALGLTQVAVWLASGVALSGGAASLLGIGLPLFARPSQLVFAVVFFVLGFLNYAVLMGVAGSLGTSQHESQQIGGFAGMFASLPLFLGGFIIQNPNMTLARILSWFPLSAPVMMQMRMAMTDVPTIDIVASLAVSVLAIPILLWAGAKVFRMGLLMYGKRPSLAEIWRAIRQV